MSDSWLARRLGAPPAQPTVRYQPGQPWPPQQLQPPQQQPYVPPSPYTAQQQQAIDLSQVRITNVQELLAVKDLWQGTAEEKQNTALCPKCGGPLQMFTQLGAPKIMNRDGVSCRPMERCHYCGYNGHFEQLGQQLTDHGISVKII